MWKSGYPRLQYRSGATGLQTGEDARPAHDGGHAVEAQNAQRWELQWEEGGQVVDGGGGGADMGDEGMETKGGVDGGGGRGKKLDDEADGEVGVGVNGDGGEAEHGKVGAVEEIGQKNGRGAVTGS